jgi:hypothetical protein
MVFEVVGGIGETQSTWRLWKESSPLGRRLPRPIARLLPREQYPSPLNVPSATAFRKIFQLCAYPLQSVRRQTDAWNAPGPTGFACVPRLEASWNSEAKVTTDIAMLIQIRLSSAC